MNINDDPIASEIKGSPFGDDEICYHCDEIIRDEYVLGEYGSVLHPECVNRRKNA